MWLSLLVGFAFAQDPVESGPDPSADELGEAEDQPEDDAVRADRPLAIPLAAPRPEPARIEAAPDAEKVAAFRKYRSQFLSVRHYTGLAVGSTTVHTDWYGGYGYGYGWGTVHRGVPYIYRVDDWGVFQGPQRLDTFSYLDRVGDLNKRQIVKQQVRSRRTLGGVLYALGGAGVVGSIASAAGMVNAKTQAEYSQWRIANTTSVGVIIGGFLGGSFPFSRARRLASHPGQSSDLAVIEDQVAEFNEGLRTELGLTPAEALSVEDARSR